jgi:hypothetical protein
VATQRSPIHRAPVGFFNDLSNMGAVVAPDGSRVTLSPSCMEVFFGRPPRLDFHLSIATRDLHLLRRMVSDPDGEIHIPVNGYIIAEDGMRQTTTRLIAEAWTWTPGVRITATHWRRSSDGQRAWIVQDLLAALDSTDVNRFNRIQALWAAGIKPLHQAPLFVTAGLTNEEAVEFHTSDRTDEELEQALKMLIALRTPAPSNRP